MSPEHDRALCEAFPRLYRERHASVMESSMGWGFLCGDGWFEIVWELSRAVSEHAARVGLDPVVRSVKEKFGELRVSVEGGDEEIERLVVEAGERSRGRCGECGGSYRVAEGTSAPPLRPGGRCHCGHP